MMGAEDSVQILPDSRSMIRFQNSTNRVDDAYSRNVFHHGSYQSVESDMRVESGSRQERGQGCAGRIGKFKDACCSASAKKIYYGVCLTIFLTVSWVTTTHFLKYLYGPYKVTPTTILTNRSKNITYTRLNFDNNKSILYRAPYFTVWFYTNWLILFFPAYYIVQLVSSKSQTSCEILCEALRSFRNSRYTLGRFVMRTSMFCMLWIITNYLYVCSFRILLATEVIALYAIHVAYVYMMSWVILHQQFVGLRIIAIILCDTGVALLAYMDEHQRGPTLQSVVLTAFAAIGSAVFKVLFRKSFGDVNLPQVSLFFSLIGLMNAMLFWPFCLILYFSGREILSLDDLPLPALVAASTMHLVTCLIINLGGSITYELFITLGLITSVPVSAALDVVLYGINFEGMRLSGIVLISIGFLLVMFPDNWPDYFTRLIRCIILMSRNARWNRKNRGVQVHQQRNDMDYRTGYIRSHLRSPSGRVR